MNKETVEFEKEKIFEKLSYQPEPGNYSKKIPWKVQQQIAATNGKHFIDSIGKLDKYPIPDIPIQKAPNSHSLLLDIGCGWGRWVTSAGLKNYIPIGIDLRLEFCETARFVMKEHGTSGYTLVADLKEPPFKDNVFDVVWSFSVIQHTHKERLLSCINGIYKSLVADGYCFLEFPNKGGIRNRMGPIKHEEKTKDDYNSWCVRYYSIAEYKEFFRSVFGNFSFQNHSFLGIGVLPNDLEFAKGSGSRLGIRLSLGLSWLTNIIKPLKYFSDSIYIKCFKEGAQVVNDQVKEFLKLHSKDPHDNLNIVSLLKCPISGGDLVLNESKTRLLSPAASVYFPVVNGTPIIVRSQAVPLS